jgi:hypothetical protein
LSESKRWQPVEIEQTKSLYKFRPLDLRNKNKDISQSTEDDQNEKETVGLGELLHLSCQNASSAEDDNMSLGYESEECNIQLINFPLDISI